MITSKGLRFKYESSHSGLSTLTCFTMTTVKTDDWSIFLKSLKIS